MMSNTHGHTESSMLTGVVCALNGLALLTADCAWPTGARVSRAFKAGCLSILGLEEVAWTRSAGGKTGVRILTGRTFSWNKNSHFTVWIFYTN
jgi:hypothetical protein